MTEPTPGPCPRAALAMSAGAASAVLDPESRAALDACATSPRRCWRTSPPRRPRRARRRRTARHRLGLPVPGRRRAAGGAPLRAVVHTAGSVRGHVTDACWDRGVEVSSAAAANAVPVAEYTLAMILLTGKRVLESAREYRASAPAPTGCTPRTVGNHRRTVGILSASLIGRRVIDLLRPHDVDVLLHDPYVDEAEAARLGVRGVGLAELFRMSDTVSVHTAAARDPRPGLPGADRLHAARRRAHQHRTRRGPRPGRAHRRRPRRAHRAVLDVTEPEVLPPDHPLWDCDHVLITPHLAGSQGNEWRLADAAVSEVARWAAGEASCTPSDAKGWPSSHEHPVRTARRRPRHQSPHRIHPGPLGGGGGRAAHGRLALGHPAGALLHLPGRPSRSGVRSDGLEGYARTFLAAAFRVAGADGDDPRNLLERYAAGLAAGTRTPAATTASPGPRSSTSTSRASPWSSPRPSRSVCGSPRPGCGTSSTPACRTAPRSGCAARCGTPRAQQLVPLPVHRGRLPGVRRPGRRRDRRRPGAGTGPAGELVPRRRLVRRRRRTRLRPLQRLGPAPLPGPRRPSLR